MRFDNTKNRSECFGVGESIRVIDRYIPNEEMSLYFAACDMVAQPYRSASGSGVARLAFGFDRPVIATRVGSLGEVIEDGKNGRLVDPGDTRGSAKAVLACLEPEVKKKLSENAVRTKEKFSWDRFVQIITQN